MQTDTITIMHSDVTVRLYFALSQGYFFIFLPYLLKSHPILKKKTPEDGDFNLSLFYCSNIWIKRGLGQ